MAHAGTLQIDHLSKQYEVKGEALPVLDDITLTVNPGEFVSICLLYTSPSPRDGLLSRMPSSA